MYSVIFKMLRKNFRNGRMWMMQSGVTVSYDDARPNIILPTSGI